MYSDSQNTVSYARVFEKAFVAQNRVCATRGETVYSETRVSKTRAQLTVFRDGLYPALARLRGFQKKTFDYLRTVRTVLNDEVF
jgi:hypothetical protein